MKLTQRLALRPPTNYDTAGKQTTVATHSNSSHNIHVSLFFTLNMYFTVEKNEAVPSHLPASSPLCHVGLLLLHAITAKGWPPQQAHACSRSFLNWTSLCTVIDCPDTQRILPPRRARSTVGESAKKGREKAVKYSPMILKCLSQRHPHGEADVSTSIAHVHSSACSVPCVCALAEDQTIGLALRFFSTLTLVDDQATDELHVF